MKNVKTWIAAVIMSMSLALSACSEIPTSIDSDSSPADSYSIELNIESQEETEQIETSSEFAQISTVDEQEFSSSKSDSEDAEQTSIPDEQQKTIPDLSQNIFSIDEVTPYSGQPYVVINNNIPYFSEGDLTTESFEFYSDLDNLERCGVAYASIGLDLMPTEERGNIGQVKPTGWHTVKYDCVDGKYLYNRCHLIGYQLSGENANEKNLITGTRYLNVQGMLPFENMVADYVKETENHVLYRVTPIFEGDNLLASGVLMEAMSVEDNGEDIQFCVYAYNVQPNIIIDYTTGESSLDPSVQTSESASASIPEQTAEPTPNTTPESTVEPTEQPDNIQEDEAQAITYILNTNTKKFHYTSCKSVKQMSDKNKQEYTGSRDDVISMGYEPCKNCNP